MFNVIRAFDNATTSNISLHEAEALVGGFDAKEKERLLRSGVTLTSAREGRPAFRVERV